MAFPSAASHFPVFPYEVQLFSWENNIYPWLQKDLHTPFWRLYWNLSEGGIIRLADGHEIALKTDTIMIVPGYLEFSTYSTRPFEQFFVHFLFRDNIVANNDRIVMVPGDATFSGFADQFISLFQNLAENQLQCEIIAHTLLGYALLKCRDQLKIRQLPVEQRILDCVDYINSHLDAKLDNQALAKYCNMAQNSFIRLFTNNMKESPQMFVRRKRVEEACHLLHLTNMSIKEISHQVGFSDQLYFTKVFSKQQHVSPKEFRRRNFSHRNWWENGEMLEKHIF